MQELDRPGDRRRAAAAAALARITPVLRRRAAHRVEPADLDALMARVEQRYADVHEALSAVHRVALPDRAQDRAEEVAEALLLRCLTAVVDAVVDRPEDLRRLDRRREIDPTWHLSQSQVGYVCFADRFAGDLRGVAERIGYLRELGVTYLHLMPLLAHRPGDADGGYAVADYAAVDPRLGSRADLSSLARDLRGAGISLCVDLVVNHTAREHAWAQAAMAGDPRYRAFYRIHPDRTMPDRFEATLPEVFPDTAPGSFTWVEEVQGWVWTTFRAFQWDLDHANPEVFEALLRVMLDLANLGVEVLRLDAVPFLWKREGTDCQNQPEVHRLLQAWRGLLGMAAPAVRCKAEAIVGPGELVPYLGVDPETGVHRPECDLAYHNQLMVQLWSSLASRDARLAAQALGRVSTPPAQTGWVTYVRGHDDIGWAIADGDAAAVGLDAVAHRRFLSDFYAGDFPLSFAEGRRFQVNPITGDARTSGMAATLCGITQALRLDDPALLEQAIRRLVLLYGIAAAAGGTPLLWMGDELGMGDDAGWVDDPDRALDNRWAHRPFMDWDAAARRADPDTVEGRVHAALRHLLAVRARTPELRAGGRTTPVAVDHPAVLALRREHPAAGRLLVLASFDDVEASVDMGVLSRAGLGPARDLLTPGGSFPSRAGRLTLPPLALRWLAEDR